MNTQANAISLAEAHLPRGTPLFNASVTITRGLSIACCKSRANATDGHQLSTHLPVLFPAKVLALSCRRWPPPGLVLLPPLECRTVPIPMQGFSSNYPLQPLLLMHGPATT